MAGNMALTFTFSKQRQNASALGTDLQSTWEIVPKHGLQQSVMSSSAVTVSCVSRTGCYSSAVSAFRSEDDGTSAYVNGPVAPRRKICEVTQAKFLELARSEYFEYGYTPPSERHLLQFAAEYPGLIGEVIQNIYLAESADACVMLALLNALASLSYETVRPHGQVLAVAALTNPNAEVKEAAIRVYETWGHREGAKILATVECPWAWLDDYRKQVISDLGGDA
jgi:hypothetical protein